MHTKTHIEVPVPQYVPEWVVDVGWEGLTLLGAAGLALLYRGFDALTAKIRRSTQYSIDRLSSIKVAMGRLQEYTLGDRVLLYEFHNGCKSDSGYHFQRFSATIEVTRPEVSAIHRDLQDLQLATVSDYLRELETQPGHVKLYRTEDLDSLYRQLLASYGVTASLTRLIKLDGAAIGFCVVHYNRDHEDFLLRNELSLDRLERFYAVLTREVGAARSRWSAIAWLLGVSKTLRK